MQRQHAEAAVRAAAATERHSEHRYTAASRVLLCVALALCGSVSVVHAAGPGGGGSQPDNPTPAPVPDAPELACVAWQRTYGLERDPVTGYFNAQQIPFDYENVGARALGPRLYVAFKFASRPFTVFDTCSGAIVSTLRACANCSLTDYGLGLDTASDAAKAQGFRVDVTNATSLLNVTVYTVLTDAQRFATTVYAIDSLTGVVRWTSVDAGHMWGSFEIVVTAPVVLEPSSSPGAAAIVRAQSMVLVHMLGAVANTPFVRSYDAATGALEWTLGLTNAVACRSPSMPPAIYAAPLGTGSAGTGTGDEPVFVMCLGDLWAINRNGTQRWFRPPRPYIQPFFWPAMPSLSLTGDPYVLYPMVRNLSTTPLGTDPFSLLCRHDKWTGNESSCIAGDPESDANQIFWMHVMPTFSPTNPAVTDPVLNPCYGADPSDQSLGINWLNLNGSIQWLERWCDTPPSGQHGWRADFNVDAYGSLFPPVLHSASRLIFWVKTSNPNQAIVNTTIYVTYAEYGRLHKYMVLPNTACAPLGVSGRAYDPTLILRCKYYQQIATIVPTDVRWRYVYYAPGAKNITYLFPTVPTASSSSSSTGVAHLSSSSSSTGADNATLAAGSTSLFVTLPQPDDDDPTGGLPNWLTGLIAAVAVVAVLGVALVCAVMGRRSRVCQQLNCLRTTGDSATTAAPAKVHPDGVVPGAAAVAAAGAPDSCTIAGAGIDAKDEYAAASGVDVKEPAAGAAGGAARNPLALIPIGPTVVVVDDDDFGAHSPGDGGGPLPPAPAAAVAAAAAVAGESRVLAAAAASAVSAPTSASSVPEYPLVPLALAAPVAAAAAAAAEPAAVSVPAATAAAAAAAAPGVIDGDAVTGAAAAADPITRVATPADVFVRPPATPQQPDLL